MHGVNQINPIPAGYHEKVTNQINLCVSWTTPGLKIVRFRLLSDPGFPVWDVSYCHGQLKTGEYVRVDLPFSQVPKRNMMGFILDHAKRDRVYAKGIGLFANMSTLI